MNANFRGKGRPPPTIFGTKKVESLSYRMVKKIAEKFNRLSRVHRRHRQTDRQTTDRQQTTDGRLIAYSDREREFTIAKNEKKKKQQIQPEYKQTHTLENRTTISSHVDQTGRVNDPSQSNTMSCKRLHIN